MASRRRKIVAAWSSVAAVLLLVVAVAGLAGRGGDSGSGSLEAAGGPTTPTLETPAPLPSGAGGSNEAESPATTALSPTTRATRPRSAPPTTAPKPPGAGGGDESTPAPTSPMVPTTQPTGGTPAPATADPGPPPPFYNSPAPGDSADAAPA